MVQMDSFILHSNLVLYHIDCSQLLGWKGGEDNVLIILHYNTPRVNGELIYNKLVFMWQSKHTLTHISCIIELRISITQIIRLILG